ncbi:helix-turn-helix domain-containing protein [Maricurvus nonylphenolicus]|uniref:helix-turn-helix domain-containing protein n=1 Tax=Maricurvus nonylphenolicus TaxID=1008307 RepID=UPI0036F1FDDA
MDQLTTALLAFAFSQICLTITVLVRDNWRYVQARLFVLLMISGACYTIHPLISSTPLESIGWLFSAGRTAIPGLIWLVCYSLFNDQLKLKAWQWTLVGITVVLPTVGHFFGGRSGLPETLPGWGVEFFYDTPQLLEVVLLVHALLIVGKNWQGDLVQSRRNLRLPIMGFTLAYTCAVVFMEQVIGSTETAQVMLYTMLSVFLLWMNSFWVRSRSHGIFAEPAATESSEAKAGLPEADLVSEPQEQAIAERESEAARQKLIQVMDDGAYNQHGLTIGDLAEQMGWQEYRLRRLINGELGYRNFNDFLNRYRVKIAAERLGDPECAQLPVLTIALDVGYRSLSSFNKAFKEAHGVTPTSYRKQNLPS